MLHKRKRIVFDGAKECAIGDYSRKPSLTFTNKHLLHSKSTYFYRWLVPATCGMALLCGVGLVSNPTTRNNTLDSLVGTSGSAYAETITANPTSYSSISMIISNGVSGELSSGDTVTTNVEPGLVNYIDNNIKISTSKIDRFYVTVQATEDSTNELTGTEHGETIAPVGNNVAVDSFGDNTWGYALGDTTTSNSSFTYNSLPAYNTTIIPQYISAQNLQDGNYNLKLTFAAKINADKPSDHYTTKAMVSVAADAAKLTSMQEFAKAGSCSMLDGQVQLRDSRDDKIYWVGKLKDSNCWMTQNLDLALTAGAELSSADTDILDASGKYTIPTNLGNYNDPGMINYKTSAASIDYSSGCGNPAADEACKPYFEAYVGAVFGDEKAHYLIGDYYPWTIAMAGQTTENSGSICPRGWKVPTNSEYSTLISGIANTNATTNTIRTSPYYFVPTGDYSSGYYRLANGGNLWSSTPNGGSSFNLYFATNNLGVYGNGNRTAGQAIRCVLK